MSYPSDHSPEPHIKALEPRTCQICDCVKPLYDMSSPYKGKDMCKSCRNAKNRASRQANYGRNYDTCPYPHKLKKD